MKFLACLLFTFAFILPETADAQRKSKKNTPPTADIEAIKAVIEKETKAFFEIDYKTWKDSWSHVPYAYWSFADTTDVNYFEGWDKIHAGFSDYFKTQKPSKAIITRIWHDFRVNGNIAYVRFTQLVQDDVARDEHAEVRILEKTGATWKIVHVGVIAKQKVKPSILIGTK